MHIDCFESPARQRKVSAKVAGSALGIYGQWPLVDHFNHHHRPSLCPHAVSSEVTATGTVITSFG